MKILGHYVHPILIVFPLGLLATATIFDVAYLVFDRQVFAVVCYWMIVAGIIGGLIASVFGWIDWTHIPSDTRAKSVGLAHGLVNTLVLLFFAGSWFLRRDSIENPAITASILTIAGAGVALVGGWLGGELVQRLGAGVHKGAHPDAPNSLVTSVIPPASDRK